MNAERLHAIALAIQNDLAKTQLIQNLQQLSQSVGQLSQQPNSGPLQQQVSNNRAAFFKSVDDSKFNDFSPTWKQLLQELGGKRLLDGKIKEEVERLFSAEQLTLAALSPGIQKIFVFLQSFGEAIDQVVSAFDKLDIGSETLEPGECELGVLVPRLFVDNQLDRFSKELGKLDKIFGVFAELATGERAGFKINTISSSDFSVFLDAAPVVCACIAKAVGGIIALYTSLLTIRKLQGELKIQGLPEEGLKVVEDHASAQMDLGINKLVAELQKEFMVGTDAGRNNELAINLKMSCKSLAGRIDRGFSIEVRMSQPEVLEPAKDDKESSDLLGNYKKIVAEATNLQFLKLEGVPILTLSDPAAEKEEENPKAPDV